MKFKITLLLLAAVTVLSGQNFTQKTIFDEQKTTGQNNHVTLFDYDGDGDDDVFSYGATNEYSIRVFHNNNGNLDSSFVFYTFINSIDDLTVFDYDGDGDSDIVAALSGTLYFFKNEGAGNFTDSSSYLAPNLSAYIDHADIDGDGLTDIVYMSYSPHQIRWIRNLGNSAFSTTVDTIVELSDRARSFELADLDNDGDIDVITQYQQVTYTSCAMSINDGTGNFTTNATSYPVPAYAFNYGYTLGDFNGDDFIDLAYAEVITDGTTRGKVHILYNDGNNVFTDTVLRTYSLVSGNIFKNIVTVEKFDFDNDGDLDLLLGETYSNQSKAIGIILVNKGNKKFSQHTSTITNAIWATRYNGNNYRGVEMFFSDFNKDDRIDILTNTYGDFDVIAHYQNSDSTFSSNTYINNHFEGITDFQTLDYDNNGSLDLITIDGRYNGKVQVNYNNNSDFSSQEVISDNRTSYGAYDSKVVLWNNNTDFDLIFSSSNYVYLHLDYNTQNDSILLLFTSNLTSLIGNIGYANPSDQLFTIEDFDNDGDKDLMIPQSTDKPYYWVENLGNYNFVEHTFSSLDFERYFMADVDGDDDLDFIGQYYNSTSQKTDYYIYTIDPNTKAYTYSSTISTPNKGTYQFAVADVDNDNDNDIIISGLEWMENDGSGNFSNPVELISGYTTLHQIVAADIDNDGLVDLLTDITRFGPTRQLIIPLFNQGNNNFIEHDEDLEVAVTNQHIITVGDYNGNGFNSIVSSTYNSSSAIPVMFDFCINSYSEDSIVACDSYTWMDGVTYTESNNTATYILTNAIGCDSIITLDLTILNSTEGTDAISVCDSYTWIDGITYTESNNSATFTLLNAVGCDSIVTLDLTITNSTTGIDVITACDSYTWIDGITYTESNDTAIDTLINAAGCDSIVTLNLTLTNTTEGVDVITACDSYTWIDGTTYTESNNTATHTLTNSVNCDSIVTLDLTILNSTTGTDEIVSCDSYTWIDGITYTESNNTAIDTLINAAGCDSIVTLNLTLTNTTEGVDVITACDSYTWIDGTTYTESNNTATHTLTNSVNCDSIVTLDLTILNSTTGTDEIVSCDSYTWIDGITYTESNNTAIDTLINAAGCDSIVTLNLTLTNTTEGVDVITACDSYTWIDGTTYTESNNTATHTLTNSVNCDSIVTLDLTILNSTTGTDEIVSCDSYTWIDGITYTESNNTAIDTLINAAGCDSIVTLNLTLTNTTEGIDVITACDSYTWIDGITYTESNNTATHEVPYAEGCDSLITLDLTISYTTYSQIIETVNGSYTSPNGNVWTETGTYIDTIMNVTGCDSIISIDLTIATGIYESDNSFGISYYPNPVKNNFFIEIEDEYTGLIHVYSLLGELLLSQNISNQKVIEVDVSELNKGIYIVELISNKYRYTFKVKK